VYLGWQLTLLQAALRSTSMLIPNATIDGGNDYVTSMSGGSFRRDDATGLVGVHVPGARLTGNTVRERGPRSVADVAVDTRRRFRRIARAFESGAA
jgi:hypothetical protein